MTRGQKQRLAREERAKLDVIEGMDRAEAARVHRVPYILLAPHNFNIEEYRRVVIRSAQLSDER